VRVPEGKQENERKDATCHGEFYMWDVRKKE
jgi:hypothetical protein